MYAVNAVNAVLNGKQNISNNYGLPNGEPLISSTVQCLAKDSEVIYAANMENATKALHSKFYSVDDISVSYCSSTEKNQTHGKSQQFKKELIQDPLETYSILRKRLSEKSHKALFPEFEGVVQYLKNHLKHPFVLDLIKGNPFIENEHKLCMLELSHISFEFDIAPEEDVFDLHPPPVDGLYPFHSTITVTRRVLDFFESLERTTKNNLPALYHADRYTYHDQNLQFNSEFIEIPSECVFTLRDFVRIRSVPIAIMGVTAKTSFADGYYNSPRDFWVHDANHNRRLHSLNQQFFKRHHITTEEERFKVYKKWDEFIKNKVMPATQIVSTLNLNEKNVRKMVKVILFELYHEQAITPDREDVLKTFNFKPGKGTPFEMIVNPENKDESYEARRLVNFNIDSGTEKYQSNMGARTIKYFYQTAANFITNLSQKLVREFYDNRYNAIKDLPKLEHRTQNTEHRTQNTEHRTPELIADALVRVTELYDIQSRELGFETTLEMRQRFIDLARNHDIHGNSVGPSEVYHQKKLEKPALKNEIVEHILNSRKFQVHPRLQG